MRGKRLALVMLAAAVMFLWVLPRPSAHAATRWVLKTVQVPYTYYTVQTVTRYREVRVYVAPNTYRIEYRPYQERVRVAHRGYRTETRLVAVYVHGPRYHHPRVSTRGHRTGRRPQRPSSHRRPHRR